jgi:hypothetical protein
MISDQSVQIKWYWEWLAENGLKIGDDEGFFFVGRGGLSVL